MKAVSGRSIRKMIAMGRLLRSIGLVLMLVAPDLALAKSGYMRPPQLEPFQTDLTSAPQIGSCGPKRYLDPQTDECRGAADWR